MSKQYCAKHVFHYSPNHIINVICPRREIGRLKAELNEAAERLGKVIQENGLLQNRVQNWPNLFDENMRLQTQLSEAQSSAEAWHDNCNIMEAALDKEREKHAATVSRLAEARAEVARLKLGMTKDYCDGCWSLQQARQEAARLEEALQQCVDWAAAYPVDIFPQPTPEQVDAVCKTLGFRIDSISAMVLRNYTGRIGEIARGALAR